MYRKTVLDNGVRVITERIPYVRSVSVGIWVTVGSRDERAVEAGISHFIEHMVFKGTKRRDAQQIAREIDSIGGASNAFTGKENTCFHAKVLDEHLPLIVDLLIDIFLESAFKSREIERERHVVLQEIGLSQDTPDDYVHELLGQAMWGDHPLGSSILGTVESVKSFGRRHISRYMARTYGPRNMLIVAAGNLDHDQLLEIVAPLFSGLANDNEPVPRCPPVARAETGVLTRELEQVHLCLGAKGLASAAPERYGAALLNVILGGSMSSRLFQSIREKKGLAYSIYSYLSSYADSGGVAVYAGVDPAKANETLRLILREIKRLKRELIPDDELSGAKKHLRGGILLSAENTDNRMTRLAKNEIVFGRLVPYEEMMADMEKVTSEDVRGLANELFRQDSLSLALVGPVEKDSFPRELLRM
ncbi:MAG: pitrilysin family protein [Pseudomonadota bacterium]